MRNKFISDFDAERLVMEMVYDYELSIRETRLEEIKGWRKALALGAAGLAGLAPIKAHGNVLPSAQPAPQEMSAAAANEADDEEASITLNNYGDDILNYSIPMPSNLHEVPGPDTGGMAAPIARFASPDGKANLSVNALGIHDSIQNRGRLWRLVAGCGVFRMGL
jgi:hypothetical protein